MCFQWIPTVPSYSVAVDCSVAVPVVLLFVLYSVVVLCFVPVLFVVHFVHYCFMFIFVVDSTLSMFAAFSWH